VSFALQAASLPVLATADHHWQMALFLGLFATGHAGAAPIMLAIRGDYFGRKHYATISGFMAMTMLAGTVLGPLVAAALDDLFDHGYSIAFVMYGGLTGAAALLIASLKQPRRPATGTPALP
jgi:MFS family permease